MIKIEVTGSNVTKKSQKGNDYTIQEAYAEIPGNKYPVKIEVFPKKGEQPYPPGLYMLAPESFRVGEFGRLECQPILTPIKGSTPPAKG